ncbi:hypothetical protein P9139_03685 [Curtobacterium flaccumfaciens]|nr:hypothetical protein P9139_03685 [Curtobacterium flaccumfaciens]
MIASGTVTRASVAPSGVSPSDVVTVTVWNRAASGIGSCTSHRVDAGTVTATGSPSAPSTGPWASEKRSVVSAGARPARWMRSVSREAEAAVTTAAPESV